VPTTIAADGLGRIFNIVPRANAVGIYVGDCAAISYVMTNDDTATLSIAKTFAGTYRAGNFFTPAWAPIVRGYTNADNGVGTGAWTRVTQAGAATFITATDIEGLFTLFTTQLPDGYPYVKCTLTTNDGVGLIAIKHDLAVQRTPANLQIMSA